MLKLETDRGRIARMIGTQARTHRVTPPGRVSGEKFLPDSGYVARLKAIYDGLGGVVAVSKATGISQSQLYRYIRSEDAGDPTVTALRKIADAAGRSLDWIVTGLESGDYEYVPRFDVGASLGYGIEVHSEQVVNYHAFRRDWLRKSGLHIKSVILVEAVGDSMLPTIRSGDLMLVDTSKRDAGQEGIYVIEQGNALKAKRLRWLVSGELEIISDNREKYPPERMLPVGTTDTPRIIGRVHSRYGEIS